MFRPYNLKSIALWTAGSLAGIRAYYETKAAYSTGRLRAPKVMPVSILRTANRVNSIDTTIRNFIENLKTLQLISEKVSGI